MPVLIFGMAVASNTNGLAQTQTVTLAVMGGTGVKPPSEPDVVTTNQIVTITSLAGAPIVTLYHASG